MEEVYYFRSDPRLVGASILLTVDANSYTSCVLSSQLGYPHAEDERCRHRRSLDRELLNRQSASDR